MENGVFVPGAEINNPAPVFRLAKWMGGWNVVFPLWVIVHVNALKANALLLADLRNVPQGRAPFQPVAHGRGRVVYGPKAFPLARHDTP